MRNTKAEPFEYAAKADEDTGNFKVVGFLKVRVITDVVSTIREGDKSIGQMVDMQLDDLKREGANVLSVTVTLPQPELEI